MGWHILLCWWYSIDEFNDDDIAFISILTNHYGVDQTRFMKRNEAIKPMMWTVCGPVFGLLWLINPILSFDLIMGIQAWIFTLGDDWFKPNW